MLCVACTLLFGNVQYTPHCSDFFFFPSLAWNRGEHPSGFKSLLDRLGGS